MGFNRVDVKKAAYYGCEDADVTVQLHHALRGRVAQVSVLDAIDRLELDTSAVLTTIERNGVRIDAHVLAMQSHEQGEKLLDLEKKAYELAGQPFNLNSPKQLGEILFQRMQLPVVRKTAGGAPSTDEDVLKRLARDYPLARKIN